MSASTGRARMRPSSNASAPTCRSRWRTAPSSTPVSTSRTARRRTPSPTGSWSPSSMRWPTGSPAPTVPRQSSAPFSASTISTMSVASPTYSPRRSPAPWIEGTHGDDTCAPDPARSARPRRADRGSRCVRRHFGAPGPTYRTGGGLPDRCRCGGVRIRAARHRACHPDRDGRARPRAGRRAGRRPTDRRRRYRLWRADQRVRTVRQYDAAGVAAIQLEDQAFPKRCGHLEGKEVVGAAEFEQTLAAALDARSDEDLLVIARTDARGPLGLDEAITRANRYARAGADVIFVEAPRGADEIERIAREVDAPLLINLVVGGLTPLQSAARLQELGYAIAIHPGDALARATFGALQAMCELVGSDPAEHLPASPEDFFNLVGMAEWAAIDRRYAEKGARSWG